MGSIFLTRFMRIAGVLLSAVALGICLRAKEIPRLWPEPEGAKECAEQMMEAVCRGDLEEAQEYVYGVPGPAADCDAGTGMEQLAWEAFVKSLSYQIPGKCYGAADGVRLDVQISCLNMQSVMEALGKKAEALLQERISKIDDITKIYDNQNEYRKPLVQQILREALVMSLQDAQVREQTIPLHLIYENGQWWILPDSALTAALSGR